MGFDLAAYARRADRLRWDDLDFSPFDERPLDASVRRCLRYMHDVEFHTACYLRDLLVTPAHADPEVTGFLSMWAYEEYWHGEAIGAVLAHHGEPHGSERVGDLRAGLGWRDRLRPMVMAAGGWLRGEDLVALQMTWGMINESVTQTGYNLLADRAGHPVLSELLQRIVRQEALHLAFYTSQAKRRLEASTKTQTFVRSWLSRLWRPVGSGVMPQEETSFLHDFLIADPDGYRRLVRIDQRVDRLAGLSGLGLVARSFGAPPLDLVSSATAR